MLHGSADLRRGGGLRGTATFSTVPLMCGAAAASGALRIRKPAGMMMTEAPMAIISMAMRHP